MNQSTDQKAANTGAPTETERGRAYGPDEHYAGEGTRQGSGQDTSLSQRAPVRGGAGRDLAPGARPGWTWQGADYNNPFAVMQRLSDEMDRMFESFGLGPALFGRGGTRPFSPTMGGMPGMRGGMGNEMQSLWSPHIEVSERADRLLVEADLPGVRREDLQVEIEQDAILIQGQRRREQATNERGYYHSERSYGSFHRVIPLPEGADADNARARFRDGVLEIEVPLKQRPRGRRLDIQDVSGTGSGETYESGTASGDRATGSAGGTRSKAAGATGSGGAGTENATQGRSPGDPTGRGRGASGGSAGSV